MGMGAMLTRRVSMESPGVTLSAEYYPGKKDHHKRVTTESAARPSRNRMTYELVGCVELAMTHRSLSFPVRLCYLLHE